MATGCYETTGGVVHGLFTEYLGTGIRLFDRRRLSYTIPQPHQVLTAISKPYPINEEERLDAGPMPGYYLTRESVITLPGSYIYRSPGIASYKPLVDPYKRTNPKGSNCLLFEYAATLF